MNTTEAALAAMKDFWLSDDSLTPEQENRVLLATRKLLTDSLKFLTSANPKQKGELRKQGRFYLKATLGPALSTTWKRSRPALFLNKWKVWSRDGKIQNGRILNLDALEYLQVLRPILEALHTDNDQFFSDLAIAIRSTKKQSQANAFLAEYSLLMLGKQPVFTFTELHKSLHFVDRDDLRKKIRKFRRQYGELAVPLKRGKSGRPLGRIAPSKKTGG